MTAATTITPLISIVTVCYNSEKTIADTIESVLNQTYGNDGNSSSSNFRIEYLLIDGSSKDNTLNIIKSYANLAAQKNISYKYISEPDNGLYDAMNKGISLATGEWIGIINSDDFYASNQVISMVANKILQDATISLIYSDLVYIDNKNPDRVVRHWKSGGFKPYSFYYGWMPPHPTVFVKHNVYDQVGLFNTELKSAADYEMMLRILLINKIKPAYLPVITIKMRTGGVSNSSFKNRLNANRQDKLAWKINKIKPYWFTLYLKPIRKITQFI